MSLDVKIDSDAIVDKLKKLHKQIYTELRVDLRNAGKKIVTRSGREFQQGYGSSENPNVSKVYNAIKSMGVHVRTSSDGQTMVLDIGSISQLDRATQLPPAKATGNVFHFWRILHEGAGMDIPADRRKIPRFFGNRPKKNKPYPIRAIVQTSIFADWLPGLYPPYVELQTLARSNKQIIILKHRGMEGHRWFIRNTGELFREDEDIVNKAMNRAIDKAIKKVGMDR